jgi:osmotically-inducible protein OsmY
MPDPRRYPSRRTDEQIKKDIVDHLAWDSSVDASKVKVEVDRGNVVLSRT